MNEPEIAYANASPFQGCDDKFPKGRSILVQSFRFIPLNPGKNASPLQSPYLIAQYDRADNDPDEILRDTVIANALRVGDRLIEQLINHA
jgi:hypothetical protein